MTTITKLRKKKDLNKKEGFRKDKDLKKLVDIPELESSIDDSLEADTARSIRG